jgi:hypothetical protein
LAELTEDERSIFLMNKFWNDDDEHFVTKDLETFSMEF